MYYYPYPKVSDCCKASAYQCTECDDAVCSQCDNHCELINDPESPEGLYDSELERVDYNIKDLKENPKQKKI